jgi:hypothetical protein
VARRVSFSGQHLGLADIDGYHHDSEASLRLYFSGASPTYAVRFLGYSVAEIAEQLRTRLAESQLRASLTVLSSLEAASASTSYSAAIIEIDLTSHAAFVTFTKNTRNTSGWTSTSSILGLRTSLKLGRSSVSSRGHFTFVTGLLTAATTLQSSGASSTISISTNLPMKSLKASPSSVPNGLPGRQHAVLGPTRNESMWISLLGWWTHSLRLSAISDACE